MQLCGMVPSLNFSFYLWPQYYLGAIADKILSEDEGKHSAHRTPNTAAKYKLQGRCKLQNFSLLITTM